MKQIKTIFLCLAFVLCAGLARVEAATVALIPLINKVEFQTVEQEKVPNQIYMTQALAVLKNKPGYMIVENDRLRHAIKDNIDPYKLPTKEQMAVVSKKGNVDIIFAMELTDYGYDVDHRSPDSGIVKMNVRANLASYNRLTGKYVIKQCIDDSEFDENFTARWDVTQESWIKMVKQEFDRITRFKKK